MLEVKGDFCHDIRQILIDAGRGDDYMELSMSGVWRWNPLSAEWLDSYSLAYTISSLLNQLFGKGKEPFWQQAYTNLVRWIIELHRVSPEKWVTLQQVYRCAIDPEFFAEMIRYAEAHSDSLNTGAIIVEAKALKNHSEALDQWDWMKAGKDHMVTAFTTPLREKLTELKLNYQVKWEPSSGTEIRERVEAVKRWYIHDWQKLDNKIKSSIVEGVSVFLSIFDMPDVARVFCPPPPPKRAQAQAGAAKRRWHYRPVAFEFSFPQTHAQGGNTMMESKEEKMRLVTEARETTITVKAAARFLGVSPSLVYAYVERKQIPHYRMMGRSIRFRLSELVEWRQQFHVNGGIDEQDR